MHAYFQVYFNNSKLISLLRIIYTGKDTTLTH